MAVGDADDQRSRRIAVDLSWPDVEPSAHSSSESALAWSGEAREEGGSRRMRIRSRTSGGMQKDTGDDVEVDVTREFALIRRELEILRREVADLRQALLR